MQPETVNYSSLVAATTDFQEQHPNGIRHIVKGSWSLVLVTEGQGLIRTDSAQAPIETGDALLFPPDAEQHFRPVDGNLKHSWTVFQERVDLLRLLQWPALIGQARRVHVPEGPLRDKVLSGFEELQEAFREFSPPRRLELCFLCIHKILLWLDAANPVTTPVASDPRIMKATTYMQRHLDEKLTVGELAEYVSLSPSRFAHLFKDVAGTTPINYLRRLRMDEACILLETTRSTLAEIADKVGYCNEFHFGSSFKEDIGVSPGEYRRRHRQKGRH